MVSRTDFLTPTCQDLCGRGTIKGAPATRMKEEGHERLRRHHPEWPGYSRHSGHAARRHAGEGVADRSEPAHTRDARGRLADDTRRNRRITGPNGPGRTGLALARG